MALSRQGEATHFLFLYLQQRGQLHCVRRFFMLMNRLIGSRTGFSYGPSWLSYWGEHHIRDFENSMRVLLMTLLMPISLWRPVLVVATMSQRQLWHSQANIPVRRGELWPGGEVCIFNKVIIPLSNNDGAGAEGDAEVKSQRLFRLGLRSEMFVAVRLLWPGECLSSNYLRSILSSPPGVSSDCYWSQALLSRVLGIIETT